MLGDPKNAKDPVARIAGGRNRDTSERVSLEAVARVHAKPYEPVGLPFGERPSLPPSEGMSDQLLADKRAGRAIVILYLNARARWSSFTPWRSTATGPAAAYDRHIAGIAWDWEGGR